jgi:hypothetical protein
MPDQEREPTPEQEAEVRRLLAAARATEPVPPDVAARLDRVLEGLDEERGGHPAWKCRVVAPAWRRRRATALLAAAAAVVGIGVGIGQIDDIRGGGNDSGGAGAADDGVASAERAPAQHGPAERGSAGDRLAGDGPAGDGAAGDGAAGDGAARTPDPAARDDGSSDFAGTRPDSRTPVGRVRETSFTADANQLRRAIPAGVDRGFVRLATDQLPRGYVRTGRPFDCSPAGWGPGVLVPVFFEGMPAVLAYRPAIGESQIVELLQCGTGEARRSTTLRAG